MFCEEAARAKEKVPASPKYFTALDWNKTPDTRTIKFLSNPRRTIADEIMHKSKNPAKTSPGPAGYSNVDAWNKNLPKKKGNFKTLERRTTFVQESGWKADQSPGYKYPDVKLVSRLPRLLTDPPVRADTVQRDEPATHEPQRRRAPLPRLAAAERERRLARSHLLRDRKELHLCELLPRKRPIREDEASQLCGANLKRKPLAGPRQALTQHQVARQDLPFPDRLLPQAPLSARTSPHARAPSLIRSPIARTCVTPCPHAHNYCLTISLSNISLASLSD